MIADVDRRAEIAFHGYHKAAVRTACTRRDHSTSMARRLRSLLKKITVADIPDQDHREPPAQRSYRLQDPAAASLELASGAKVSMYSFSNLLPS